MELCSGGLIMSPMRFPRVYISKIQIKGWLNKMMPQADGSNLYEILGDDNKIYILTDNEFHYNYEEQQDEPEWKG